MAMPVDEDAAAVPEVNSTHLLKLILAELKVISTVLAAGVGGLDVDDVRNAHIDELQ